MLEEKHDLDFGLTEQERLLSPNFEEGESSTTSKRRVVQHY